jgi:hypothetical protein
MPGTKRESMPGTKRESMPGTKRESMPGTKKPRRVTSAKPARTPARKQLAEGTRTVVTGSGQATNNKLRRLASRVYRSKYVIALVSMEGCHFCTMLKPAWDHLAEAVRPLGIHVLEIDNSSLNSVMPGSNQLIDEVRQVFSGGVPHIVMIDKETGKADVYTGDRTTASLVQFAKAHLSKPKRTTKRT